jgi:phage tail sheath gpL-like
MLLPLFYAEVTTAQEPFAPALNLLIIGHMNTDEGPGSYGQGVGLENVPYLLSGTNSTTLFGRGSMIEAMYQIARMNAPFSEIWGVALGQGDVSERAVGTINVVKPGSDTRTGMARFHIAGRPIAFNVDADDLKEEIAMKVQDQINRRALPVKASGALGQTGQVSVTLTCRWKGTSGNEIALSYAGPRGRADSAKPDVSLGRYFLTFQGMSGGQGENATQATLDAIGQQRFDVIAYPFTGTAALNMIQRFLNNTVGRWSPSLQLYGHAFASMKGSFQGFYNTGLARNDPHMSIMAIKQSIIPSWEWTAAQCGVVIVHWNAPPELSRPLQTLRMEGLSVGSDYADSFNQYERNLILSYGFSTFHVNPDNTISIDRVRTTRKYNAFLNPDPSWADAITLFQAMYFVRRMRAAITGAYPRCALTDRPTGINGFTSVPQIRALIISEYIRMQEIGLVEHSELFSRYLVVERDPVDRNRVNALMRPDMVNQLRVVAVVVETHLELEADDPLLQAAA